jgi:serine/threonine protein kinase/tetratricopeptide (TPR) repeat protein
MLERIGRYRVKHELGKGGMGVVYAAHDERLDRPVAIKMIRTEALADEVARERFRREAKAAARVTHPHICTLYEFDEQDGHPFLVMELLEGESLATRLLRGAVPVGDVIAIAGPMLDALAALHRGGIIHRDLKPANVFLTPHGVKLLDFGLAHVPSPRDATADLRLTTTGVLVGTPQYLAPEQLTGGAVDERTDLFTAGVVIYEMLVGRPPFTGRHLAEIIHAITTVDPPWLDGPPEIVAIDGVLREALAKDPAQRPSTAGAFAARLRDAYVSPGTHVREHPRLTRFVALPFRMLRADPEIDFLAFSVPDAVSVALSSLESIVVRTSQAAGTATDIRAVGRDLAVDVVLTGTILRSGSRVRVTAQLIHAVGGTLMWSDTIDAPIEDLFQLQDALTQRIVASLSLPLSASDRRALQRQAPASADAYALYMRANQLMTDPRQWDAARGLYEQAVALDPTYAPAWARLGRARRVLAKWLGGPHAAGLLPLAEQAFRRALELEPDLAIAYDLSAYAEAELGRAPDAMVRLLERLARRPREVGLLAGLVTTCRYAGLFDASLAAHERAAALDPAAATSVCWSHFLRGDYVAAQAADIGTPPFCRLTSRAMRGELPVDEIVALEATATHGSQLAIRSYRQILERDFEGVRASLEGLAAYGFADPEGWYLYGFLLAHVGAADPTEALLLRAIDGGYACHDALVQRPDWQVLAHRPSFEAAKQRTAEMVEMARERFLAANGPVLLAMDGT